LGRNTEQEKYGLRNIRKIVEGGMKSDWQQFDQSNDDGIDGFITFRKNGEVTGEIVLVQSKCYSTHQLNPGGQTDQIGLNIGKDYILKHLPRWGAMIAPVVVIYTQYADIDDKAVSWWTDANDANSYSSIEVSYILLPKKQRFKGHSIGDLKKLCGYRHQDYKLPRITLDRKDVSYFKLSSQIKQAAREFYKEWSSSDISERTNPTLGQIEINRVGWRHITRRKRKPERVIQSWQLLGVAKRLIKEIKEPEDLRHSRVETVGGWKIIEDYVGLRAFVIFPHRYESSVTVVLRRQRKINLADGSTENTIIWFYSVYETRRGRTPKRLVRGV
jgi:hypothetical protein